MLLRLLALALVAFAYGGCSVSDEDRDFYYKGWVNPNEPRHWNSSHPHSAPPAGYPSDPVVDQ